VDGQVRLVQTSSAIQSTYDEATRLMQRALTALEALPEGVERQALADLAVFVTRRSI
jgi:geranylgeranyl pyrophosphate synthase